MVICGGATIFFCVFQRRNGGIGLFDSSSTPRWDGRGTEGGGEDDDDGGEEEADEDEPEEEAKDEEDEEERDEEYWPRWFLIFFIKIERKSIGKEKEEK